MKEADIKHFFDDNKQKIEDGGFSDRVFMALDYIPEPGKRKRVSFIRSNWLISVLCATGGFVLFTLFGGYTAVLDGISQLGSAVHDIKLLTPEMIVSFLLVSCSLFAVGKFAIETE
jgi:hypothetical protein